MAGLNVAPEDIEFLNQNPGENTQDFETVYGAGSAAQYIAQRQGTPSEPEETDDGSGFWDNVEEIPGAVYSGVLRSVDATGDLISRYTGDLTFYDENGAFDIKYRSGDEMRALQEADKQWKIADAFGAERSDTFTGKAVEGVSQFVAGFVGVGKFFKAGKLFSGLSAGKQGAISGLSRGAVADFVSFEGKEGNLSDFLQDAGVDTWATRQLMTNPDDTDLQNRLRNSIEGAGLGLAVEGIIKVVRAAGYLKRGDNQKAKELGAEGAEDIQKGVEGKLDEVTAREAAAGEQVPPPPASAADEAAPVARVEPEVPESQLFPETVDEALERTARENDQTSAYIDRISDPKSKNFRVFGSIVDRILTGAAMRNMQTGNVMRPGELARNFRYVTDPEDIEDIIITVGEKDAGLAKEFEAARGGETERWATVRAKMGGHVNHLKGLFENDWDGLLREFGDVPRGADGLAKWENLAASLQAKRKFVDTMSEEMQNIAEIWTKWAAKEIDENAIKGLGWKNFDEFELDAIHMTELYANLEASFRGQRAAIGRAMNAQKMVHKRGDALTAALQNQATRSRSGMTRYFREVQAAKLAGKEAPSARDIGSVWDKLNTFRINMMLSGPNTQIINAVSNFMQANINMIEQTVGGAVTLNRTEMIRGVKQFGYTYGSALEAVRMAGFAARRDQSVLDAVGGKLEIDNNPFGGQKMSLVDKEGRSIRGGANLISTLPSRLLLFSDEFFKQATYRGKLKTDLWVAGRQKGLKGDELNEWIATAEKRGFDPDGAAAALDEGAFRMALQKEGAAKGLDGKALEEFIAKNADQVNVSKAALDTAREVTFTTELEGFAAMVQQMAVKYPGVRFILPFVKTPTNLLTAAFRRTPVLNILSKKLRSDLKSLDPSVRARARGKMVTGVAAVSVAGTMAHYGMITGSGPSDPKTRAAWIAKKWRPYSFVITNDDGSKSYIPYQRYDPFSNFFGVAADLAEVWKEAELEGKKGEEDRFMDIAAGLAASVAENSINKTYMRGLSDFMGAITAADKNMERVLGSALSSYTPAAIGQLDGDPVFRETRGMMDGVKNRLAAVGIGEFSDPKRNQLGEMVYRGQDKWNPFTASTSDPNDIVLKELADLAYLTGKNFSPPKDRRIGTVKDFSRIEYKSGQSVFDRYQELIGTLKLGGGRTLRQALADAIPQIQTLHPGTQDDPNGPRAQVIGSIFNSYRQAAKDMLYIEGTQADAPPGAKQYSKSVDAGLLDKADIYSRSGRELNLEQMIKGRQ